MAEISNHFNREKYSVGLTAENKKKTDKRTGSFGPVTEIYVLCCGRKQEPKPISPFPMLSWQHIWQGHTMFSPIALGSPNSLQKRSVMTKSPVGLCSGALQGDAHVKKHPVITALTLGVWAHIQKASLQLQAASQVISHHKIQAALLRVLTAVTPPQCSFTFIQQCWKCYHICNTTQLSSFFTWHALPFSLYEHWWLVCNFWPLSFFCIGQFLNSPILATGAEKCL